MTESHFEYKTVLARPMHHTNSDRSRYIGGSGAIISLSRKRTDQNTAACWCLLYSLNRNTTDRLPKQVQNMNMRFEKTTMPSRRATNAAKQHSSSGSEKQQLQQAEGTAVQRQQAAAASYSSSLHRRKATHTNESQKLSVRFLTRARFQMK